MHSVNLDLLRELRATRRAFWQKRLAGWWQRASKTAPRASAAPASDCHPV
jgi:hypothetical protein